MYKLHILLQPLYIVLLLLSITTSSVSNTECLNISDNERIDCHPELQATEYKCNQRKCCWEPKNEGSEGVPACFFPRNYPSYYVIEANETVRSFKATLKKEQTVYFPEEFNKISVEIRQETSTRLRIRFTVPSQTHRWEPPIPLGPPSKEPILNPDYHVVVNKSPFGLKITRANRSDLILLDSTGLLSSALIFADQFLQVSFRLHAQYGFGPGELETEFPHSLNYWSRDSFWAHDGSPKEHANLYGTHNMFMGLHRDGSAFGIFLLNSNAQEVAFTPLPAIIYRTIGGILDFFIMSGPKPQDVIAQYYSLIGYPLLPPYWSLGFHLCRFGIKNLDQLISILKRNIDASIPIDAQWFDIDYMDGRKIWTIDQNRFHGIASFVNNELHRKHKIKAVIIVDPGISTKGGKEYKPYEEGIRLGIFINDTQTKNPILGWVWPGETVFPDFAHPDAEKWWSESVKEFHEKLPFDGIWIDMNEPANFVNGSTSGCLVSSKLDNPPYVPRVLGLSLAEKTICPSAHHYDTTHYNRHNMYGYEHARVTNKALKNLFSKKRPFILSRSTFAGSGVYTTHWTGDVYSTWKSMRYSVASIIKFNMFAVPMVGADICGFDGNTTEELCVRWSQLGAFYPFSRNHNEDEAIDQDPSAWSSEAAKAIREALNLRYYLLPYLYTLFFRASLNGHTVARALAFEFPDQAATHNISKQFMLGSCILVTPVLDQGYTNVDGYVPSGEWIVASTGKRIISSGQWMNFEAPIDVIPVLLRCGCIIPLQSTAQTTDLARKTGFGLVVILSSTDNGEESESQNSIATGELFWDDGDNNEREYVHYTFTVKNRKLHIKLTEFTSNLMIDPNELSLKFIFIVGLTKIPKTITVNQIPTEFNYYQQLQSCRITSKSGWTMLKDNQIEWKF